MHFQELRADSLLNPELIQRLTTTRLMAPTMRR